MTHHPSATYVSSPVHPTRAAYTTTSPSSPKTPSRTPALFPDTFKTLITLHKWILRYLKNTFKTLIALHKWILRYFFRNSSGARCHLLLLASTSSRNFSSHSLSDSNFPSSSKTQSLSAYLRNEMFPVKEGLFIRYT